MYGKVLKAFSSTVKNNNISCYYIDFNIIKTKDNIMIEASHDLWNKDVCLPGNICNIYKPSQLTINQGIAGSIPAGPNLDNLPRRVFLLLVLYWCEVYAGLQKK